MQITLWEHCASAAFSLTLSGGCLSLLLDMLCPLMCVLLPLSSFCYPHGNTSDKLLSNRHVAPLKFVFKMVSDVLLLPYFLGVAIAIHDIVLDLHQCCELFTALLLQDKLGSELEPAGPVVWSCRGSWAEGSCPWRWLGVSSCSLGCWFLSWGSRVSGAGEMRSAVMFSLPPLAGRYWRGTEPPHGTRTGSCLCEMRSVGEKFLAGVIWASWAELLESVWTVRQKRRACL